MPLIFNYGPQSGWERGTGGTNRFLVDAAHSFTSFALREEQALVSRIDQMEMSRGLRSRLLAGETSLLMNEGNFLWIQNWGILEAWKGAEFYCRNQRTPWKCLLAQGSSQASKISAMLGLSSI